MRHRTMSSHSIVTFLIVMLLNWSSRFALIPSRDCLCQSPVQSRVWKGIKANPIEFPWMVSLSMTLPDTVASIEAIRFAHVCGGVLLNEYWVLTAAHCVDNFVFEPNLLSVGVASNGDLVEMYRHRQTLVSEIHLHPDYYQSANVSYNDVAMIKLDRPIEFRDGAQPACLLPDFAQASTKELNTLLVAAGFGATHFDSSLNSQYLLKVNMFDASRKNLSLCLQQPDLLCAKQLEGSLYLGDSGSPLQTNRLGQTIVIGITSMLVRAENFSTFHYSAFTRIASHFDFIAMHIANDFCQLF